MVKILIILLIAFLEINQGKSIEFFASRKIGIDELVHDCCEHTQDPLLDILPILNIDQCPEQCRCFSSERVDCSKSNLFNVPFNIARSTITLRLNENHIKRLTTDSFYQCQLIRTLDLANNQLSDEGIPEATFAPLMQLQDLLLTNNKLKQLPPNLPDTLVTLHLAGNEIKRIDPSALALKVQLRHLYLHDNQLTTDSFQPRAFDGLSRLEEMTLSDNQISKLPPLPSSAEIIYLQNNGMAEIPSGAFRRKRSVRVLFLKKNRFSDSGFERNSFSGLKGLEFIDLSENNLTKVPEYLPTKIRRLHLERNKISNISRSALNRLRKIEYLLLHYNDIGSEGIEPGAFVKLNKLHTLHLFGNKLTEVPPQLPRNLQSLILLDNRISKISRNVFNESRKLKELDLRYNELTNRGMSRGVLKKVKSLQHVDFRGNKLKAVPGLPRRATTVFLSNNRITRIPPRALARASLLRHLTIANNRLGDDGIPTNAFRFNKFIVILDLSENKLTSIPKYLPPNVEFVYLQDNLISQIPKHAFLNSLKIKGIFLQNNQLLPETVMKSAFSPLRSLQRVDITWRPRRPDEIYAVTEHSKRRKRYTENRWNKCGRSSKFACLEDKIMVLPFVTRHFT